MYPYFSYFTFFVVELSVDTWQRKEDAVLMQSQRLVTSVALAHHHAEFILEGKDK